jgi:hypothetical protein
MSITKKTAIHKHRLPVFPLSALRRGRLAAGHYCINIHIGNNFTLKMHKNT